MMDDAGSDVRAGAPIVVVGVGRSGTSLLQSMLHAHPDLVFLPEIHFFRRYVGPTVRRWRWSASGSRALLAALRRDAEFHRAGMDPEELLAPFLSGGVAFSPGAVYRRLLAHHLERREESAGRRLAAVGVKDPRLVDFLPVLHDQLPRARVLHIIRDPRDVLLSRRGAAWSAGRPDWMHLFVYRAQLAHGRRDGERWFGDRYSEITYETLIERPRAVLEEVCWQLDIPYSERMLDFGESARELVSDEEMGWKSETTGPLLHDNKDKWRSALSVREVRLVDRICVSPFPDLPYVPAEEASPSGLPERIRNALLARGGEAFARLYGLRARFG